MTEKSKPTVRMSEQEIWQFLEQGHTGILTTLRQDGMPIALPIWYVCLDQHIYIGTRGKKLNRISNDPRASLLVEEGKRWSELRAVHMTGKAEIVNLEGDLKAFRTGPAGTGFRKMPRGLTKGHGEEQLACE